MLKIIFILFNISFGVLYANDALCIDQPDGYVFNNPSGCDAFFMCRDGVATPGTCPAGLYFDSENIACDLSENVNCQMTPGTPEPTEGITYLPEPPTAAPTQSSTELTTELPELEQDLDPQYCPLSGVHILDHPHSCNGFISCFGGALTEQSCSPGTEWDVDSRQCLISDAAQCTIEANQCPVIDDPSVIVRVPCSLDCNR